MDGWRDGRRAGSGSSGLLYARYKICWIQCKRASRCASTRGTHLCRRECDRRCVCPCPPCPALARSAAAPRPAPSRTTRPFAAHRAAGAVAHATRWRRRRLQSRWLHSCCQSLSHVFQLEGEDRKGGSKGKIEGGRGAGREGGQRGKVGVRGQRQREGAPEGSAGLLRKRKTRRRAGRRHAARAGRGEDSARARARDERDEGEGAAVRRAGHGWAWTGWVVRWCCRRNSLSTALIPGRGSRGDGQDHHSSCIRGCRRCRTRPSQPSIFCRPLHRWARDRRDAMQVTLAMPAHHVNRLQNLESWLGGPRRQYCTPSPAR